MADKISNNAKNGVKGLGRNGGSIISQNDINRVIQSRVQNILKSIEDVAVKAANTASVAVALQSIATSLNGLSTQMDKASFKGTWIKFLLFKREVKKLVKFTNSLYKITKNHEEGVKALTTVTTLAEAIGETIRNINGIKLPLFIRFRIFRMVRAMIFMVRLVKVVTLLAPMMTLGIKTIVPLRHFVLQVMYLFMSIKNTPMFFIKFKLRRIISAFRYIQLLIWRVRRVRGTKRAWIKMLLIASFFHMLALTMVMIALTFPFILLGVLAMIGMSLAFFLMAILMKLIFRSIRRIAWNVWKTMLMIGLIVLMIIAIIITLVLLSLLAPLLLKQSLLIIGLIIIVVIILALFLVVGKILHKLRRVLMKAIQGLILAIKMIVMMLVMVALLCGIALMSGVIFDNLVPLLGALGGIIAVLGIAAAIGLLGSNLIYVLPGLALAVATMGLMLAVAFELWLIQKLELDIDKIKDNISKISDAVALIKEKFVGEVSIGGLFNEMGSAASLAVVSSMVNSIESICKKLNTIQTFELDIVAIENSIDTIYKVVDKIKKKIEDNDKIPEDEGVWGAVKSAFKNAVIENLKAGVEKGKLNRVDAILAKLINISETLNEIQNVKIEETTVMKNIDLLYSFVQKIQDKIDENNKLPDDWKQDKWFFSSWFDGDTKEETLGKMEIDRIGRAEGILLKLSNIADTINTIQSLEINQEEVLNKVTLLYSFIQDIQNRIAENNKLPDDWKQDKWFFSSWFDGDSKEETLGKMEVDRIGRAEAVLLSLAGICKAVNTIKEFEIEGEAVKEKVTSILNTTNEIYDLINKGNGLPDNIRTAVAGVLNENDKKAAESVKKYTESQNRLSQIAGEYFGMAEKSFALITSMADKINTLANLEISKDSAQQKVRLTLDTVGVLMSEIEKDNYSKLNTDEFTARYTKFIEVIEDINKSVGKLSSVSSSQVSNSQKMLTNYGTFIQKVNTIDINKVKTTSDMFQKMTEFSESVNGDFDKIADAINEKLMPVLEELRKLMEDIPRQVREATSKATASINAAAKKAKTDLDFQIQSQGENQNGTPEEIKKAANDNKINWINAKDGSLENNVRIMLKLMQGSEGKGGVKIRTT